MSQAVSFYDMATGAIVPGSMLLPSAEAVAQHTPPGCAAIEGQLDHLSQRVRQVVDDFGALVPVVIDWRPDKPADDEHCTWVWHELHRRWVAAPTLRGLQARVSEPVLAELQALDAAVIRPAGEVAEALGLGLPIPAAAVARLQVVNAQKAELRARLASIAATESAQALAALKDSWA